MLNITNEKLFNEVVEAAKQRTLGDDRWIHAIETAAEQIAENPFMEWQGDRMLILSPSSDEVYTANGSCQCKAFNFNKACWHRSAYKLWKRYLEALSARDRRPATRAEMDSAPMFKPQTPAPVMKVRGIPI